MLKENIHVYKKHSLYVIRVIRFTAEVFSMGDSTAKSSHAECAKPQKKTISPDVMLHTRNVMIPVVKPVPPKQSFNISYLEYKPAILRVPNYKNNPALLFSETPLHTLYDPKNSPEVKKLGRWKCKNQSTKYTTSCSSKRLSRKKKDNMLCFPNTTFTQFESSANDQDLHKASSRSIELSRKCDLSRMKENQIKRRNMIAVLPKIEAPISSVMSKSAVSSESQSFHDIVNSISTVLPLSVSSLKIKNKKTFANIVKRKESLSSVTSNHLHPTNSEYEINVLHYENDIPRNDFSHFTQSHLKSTNTNWSFTDDYSLTKIQNYDFTKEKNVMENKAKAAHDIKYSCEINNWILPSQREERDSICETKIIGKNGRNPYDCKIKYSWQVIGTSTQTSYSLLQDLLNNSDVEDHNRNIYKMRIKYSWQIIGMSTQASLHNCSDPDYWNGILLAPNKNCNENENEAQIGNNEIVAKPRDHVKYLEKRSKKYLILNNQQTQTFAEKEIQADTSDCNAKYSWHNLIKQYLNLIIFPDMERILEALTNQKLSDKLEIDQVDNHELLHSYMIKPLTPNISSKNSVIFDNGNEKTKKEELLTRLTYALKKLNQYEQDRNKNWNTDVPCIDTEGTFVQKGEALPRNVEENVKGIIQSAQEYITKLDYQLKDLDSADQQIENSMMRTLKDIDETFQSLLDDVCNEINKRREHLILEAEIHKQESLIPLRACRKEVEAQMRNAQNIISMSKDILQQPQRYSANEFGKIIFASNDIGRIPAVPYSEELPNINFDRPLNSYKEEIMEQISRFGCISRTVPVHIMSIEERPAGLFVKWHVTNPEYIAEEQTFIVEKANGEILDPTSSKFETVYKGSETFCFIRNIPIDEPITLRVRIQADNVARSIHHVARTSIPSYSWELNNKDYLITNNGKIAAKVTDAISTLFSQDSQFDANHIIEFKFLEIPQEGSDDEGIALVYDPQGKNDTLKRAASLMITAQGKIFMDGDEKLMRLPRMHSATHITISAFRKNVHVLRVNIESENKCVTYDWRVQTPLYLAARFTERNKWHLAIE
ncbi:uncharacterized protein LOC105430647 [Pogonomyrmex barbatus]|uniref:Uncharacterized protein LOC105430647 n=1 Tax=Pogonomyrmex barbatus TaxID=144034 RepID=A0A8N1SAD9_9HYME|nr:uncharacterized protein LOC105430647 [Pogonomyrmex barbatus]